MSSNIICAEKTQQTSQWPALTTWQPLRLFGKDITPKNINRMLDSILQNHVGSPTNQGGSATPHKNNQLPTLEYLHERICLFVNEGGQPFEMVMPHGEEMAYRESIIQSLMKRVETFVEQELDQPHLRNQLVAEIVRLHSRSKFKPQCLFLAIRLADRYLSRKSLSAEKYEALGNSVMLICVKLTESLKSFELDHWISRAITTPRQQLKEMENEVLETLDWQPYQPTVFSYFEILATYFTFQCRTFSLCLYLLELSQLQAKFLRYSCHNIAVSAVYLSLMMLEPSNWNQVVIQAFKVKLPQIRQLAKQLLKALLRNQKSAQSYTLKKFSKSRHYKIARLRIQL